MKTLIHEMRNQLAVAVANIEAFLDGKLSPTETRLQSVLHALMTLDTLIDDIPASTNGNAQPEHNAYLAPLNACALIQVTLEGLKAAAASKNIQLSIAQCGVIHAECQNFVGDRVRLVQIISNLVLNAISYTPVGGKISIDCHRELGKIMFLIENTGPGLTDEDMLHIFEAGYRGSASKGTQGSGLGLAFVKEYLEGQGGGITVQRLEQGAAFTLSLAGSEACGPCQGCSIPS